MYSQNNEEEIIMKHLGHMPTGRFLDIGAYDGITLSNTYRLYESAWDGVLVDPSPIAFVKLMETYAETLGNPEVDIRLINAAVVPGQSKLIVLHDASGDPLSTVNGKTLHLWPKTNFYPITINTVNIIDFLDHVGYDFDMISMDADGMNLELFLSLPLEKLTKLKMIVVEHEGYVVRLTQYLGSEWTLIDINPENAIYLRNG